MEGKRDALEISNDMHFTSFQEQYKYLYSAVTKELTGKESGIQENEFMTYYSQLKHNDQLTGRTFIGEEFDVKFWPNEMFSFIH